MGSDIDERIASLARSQLGLVARRQLMQHGVSAEMVDGRLRSGRFRRIHRGVYVIGPLSVPNMREMAAVLATGPESFVSYRSAGRLRQVLPEHNGSAPVDISIPSGDRGRRPGIRLHRASSLLPVDVTMFERIPITTVTRTLFDLATVLAPRDLERALAAADRRDLLDCDGLRALLARHGRRRGTPMLRSLIEDPAGPAWTRSEGEERFLALLRRTDLPAPEVNATVGTYEVDFLWRAEGVIVEIDGFRFHASRQDFERDRLRDARLMAGGLHVMRVTWRQIADRPEAVLVRLGQVLGVARISAG